MAPNTRSATRSLPLPVERQNLDEILGPESSSEADDSAGAQGMQEEADEPAAAEPPQRIPSIPTSNPYISTDETLKHINIGLFAAKNVPRRVWYCLTCRETPGVKTNGLCTPMIRDHVLKFHKLSLRHPHVKEALASLNLYGAWDGTGNAPVPNCMVPAYSFLRTWTKEPGGIDPEACGECPGPHPYIWVDSGTRSRHLSKKHGKDVGTARQGEKYTAVQTFMESPTYKRYFPVSLALTNVLPAEPTQDQVSKNDAIIKYLEIMRANEPEETTVMGPSQGLQDEGPFIHSQGWPDHFENEDATVVTKLVAKPVRGHAWAIILPACLLLLLNEYEPSIIHSNHKFRKQWIDAGDGQDNAFATEFGVLKSSGAKSSYTLHFAELILLVLRVAKLKLDRVEDQYCPYLTPEQLSHATALIAELRHRRGAEHLTMHIHKLAVACFAPEDTSLMARSQFHDINHVYIALKALQPDRSFLPPDKFVRPTTALQYFFRATLMHEATIQTDLKFEGNTARAFKHYRTFLMDTDEVTPFSTLRTLRKFLLDTVASTAGYGSLHWAGENMSHCSYHGRTFELAAVKTMAQTLVQRTEELLFSKVLFDIPLHELGYTQPNYRTLQDLKTARGNRYSLWRDTDNVTIQAMQDNLLTAFSLHPKLDGWFWSKRLPDGSPEWLNERRMQWLRDVGECAESLGLSAHIYGGGPRRAKEFAGMRIHNIEARPRDLLLHGYILIFILGYSKTAALTLRDRMDVHALTPRLTDLFFIFNALVRPLAVLWVKDILDPAYLEAEQSDNASRDGDDLDDEPAAQLEDDDNMEVEDGDEANTTHHSGYQDDIDLDLEGDDYDFDNDEEDDDPDVDVVGYSDAEVEGDPMAEDEEVDADIRNMNDQDSQDEYLDPDGKEPGGAQGSASSTEESESSAIGARGQTQARAKYPAHSRPSIIQDTYAFASVGSKLSPSRFSKLLANYTKEFLGVPLPVSSWRHVCIAIQRDHLGLVDMDGTRKFDTVYDQQAGHSHGVAETYYAVNETDRNLVGAGSIDKYVRASRLYHDWLDGKDMSRYTSPLTALNDKINKLESEVSELKAELKLANTQLAQVLAILTGQMSLKGSKAPSEEL